MLFFLINCPILGSSMSKLIIVTWSNIQLFFFQTISWHFMIWQPTNCCTKMCRWPIRPHRSSICNYKHIRSFLIMEQLNFICQEWGHYCYRNIKHSSYSCCCHVVPPNSAMKQIFTVTHITLAIQHICIYW